MICLKAVGKSQVAIMRRSTNDFAEQQAAQDGVVQATSQMCGRFFSVFLFFFGLHHSTAKASQKRTHDKELLLAYSHSNHVEIS